MFMVDSITSLIVINYNTCCLYKVPLKHSPLSKFLTVWMQIKLLFIILFFRIGGQNKHELHM